MAGKEGDIDLFRQYEIFIATLDNCIPFSYYLEQLRAYTTDETAAILMSLDEDKMDTVRENNRLFTKNKRGQQHEWKVDAKQKFSDLSIDAYTAWLQQARTQFQEKFITYDDWLRKARNLDTYGVTVEMQSLKGKGVQRLADIYQQLQYKEAAAVTTAPPAFTGKYSPAMYEEWVQDNPNSFKYYTAWLKKEQNLDDENITELLASLTEEDRMKVLSISEPEPVQETTAAAPVEPANEQGPFRTLFNVLQSLGAPLSAIAEFFKETLATIVAQLPMVGGDLADRIRKLTFPDEQLQGVAENMDKLVAKIGGKLNGSDTGNTDKDIMMIITAIVSMGAASQFANGGMRELMKKAPAMMPWRNSAFHDGAGGFDEW